MKTTLRSCSPPKKHQSKVIPCVCVFASTAQSTHLCRDMRAYVKDYAYINIFVYCMCVVIHAGRPGVMFPPSAMILYARVCVCVCVWCISMGQEAHSRGPEGDKSAFYLEL